MTGGFILSHNFLRQEQLVSGIHASWEAEFQPNTSLNWLARVLLSSALALTMPLHSRPRDQCESLPRPRSRGVFMVQNRISRRSAVAAGAAFVAANRIDALARDDGTN